MSNLDYLIPYVRLRVGDMNPAAYRYTDDWVRTALTVAVMTSARWLNNRYLLDALDNVYRNPNEFNWLYDEATYGIIQPIDEPVIILLSAIVMLEGSLENSAWNVSSWRDAEISYSNLEQAKTKDRNIARLWDELMNTLRPPVKRLARSKKQSLPGFKDNAWEVDQLK